MRDGSVMRELFSQNEIRGLLQQDEGQFLEFKSLWNLDGDMRRVLDRRAVRNTIAECVAAFANADGGTLLLGVDDDGTPTGHGYPEEAVAEFLAVAQRRLRPAVAIRHQRVALDGNEIIVIQVHIAPEAVMVDGDGFPYRVGDQIRLEPQEVINQRKQAYRTVGYECRFNPDATLENLDLTLAGVFLSRSVYRARSPEEALRELGLIAPRAGGFAITNAALLLFGKRPFARWHPRAGIRMFRVAGTERRHGKHRNVTQLGSPIEPPLALAIPEAHRLAASQIRRSEKLHDLFFREMPEYPEFAWQEAVINAVAHRDYNDQGREIEVWFFDDRMEVLSPGDLVPPVTIEQLRERRRVHASRNPLLVRVLASVGIMRDEGEGVPRIFEEMQESLLKEPQIAVEASQVVVRLCNEPLSSGPTAEWQAVVSRLDLTNAQKQALLAFPNGFTDEQYRAVNALNRDQARRDIEEMVAKGVLMPAMAGQALGNYRLSQHLRDTAAWLEQRIPRLQAFFGTHDRLTNAGYREIFGVSRFTARHELARLVDEGLLVQKGERKAAHYVAGTGLVPKQ
jgi:ATP-dependent DNA helicase RecG